MNEHTTYGIIGAGAIGQALGATLRRAGRTAEFWDQDASLCTIKSTDELAKHCNVLILAVPSNAVRPVIKELKAHLSKHTVLTVAKGVEAGFVTMDQVFAAELDDSTDYGFLYGPMLAGEVTAGEYGYGTLASKQTDTTQQIIADLAAGKLFVRPSNQVHDVVLCAVLKNIYALGLGVADGLDLGMNAKAQLTVNMLAEMHGVLRALQLDGDLAYGSSGLGDLLATGWGSTSYNHHVGEAIGEGATSGLSGEGLNSLMEIPHVLELSNFPILKSLHHIIVSKAPAEQLSDLIR